MMATQLRFQTLAAEQHLMHIAYRNDNGKSGIDSFVLLRERPADARDGKVYETDSGRKFQIGTVKVCGHLCFVAWPLA